MGSVVLRFHINPLTVRKYFTTAIFIRHNTILYRLRCFLLVSLDGESKINHQANKRNAETMDYRSNLTAKHLKYYLRHVM